jgi:hypothetical protein
MAQMLDLHGLLNFCGFADSYGMAALFSLMLVKILRRAARGASRAAP